MSYYVHYCLYVFTMFICYIPFYYMGWICIGIFDELVSMYIDVIDLYDFCMVGYVCVLCGVYRVVVVISLYVY